MLQDSITLLNGAVITNMVAPSGTAFPALPDTGELFFNTTTNNLFVYITDSWVEVGSGGGGAVSSVAGKTGAVTLNYADVAGLALVASSGAYNDLTGAPTVWPAGQLSGNALAAGVTSSSLTSVGTLTSLDVSGNITTNGLRVGYLEAPQRIVNSTTLVLADSGKHLRTTSGGLTITVPANSVVPFPIGTAITIVNPFTLACTLTINTDVMYLAGTAGSTGNRTIGQFGTCTLLKIDTTQWIISGVNIT